MIRIAAAFCFLAVNFYIYNYFATEAVTPPRQSFAEFPETLEGWHCVERETLEEKVLNNLGVTDYLICTYQREEPAAVVAAYVGYHETQVREEGGGGGENAIHPPKHCLPGSGWSILDASVVELELPGLPPGAQVNRMIIAKGNARQLVYYWYHSRGRVIAQDWRKLIALFWDRATQSRTDGSLVRFTVPVVRDQYDVAEASFRDLASAVVPRLPAYVPQ